MKNPPPAPSLSRAELEQMPISVLVELVLQQQGAIGKLTSEIEKLSEEIERLKQRPRLHSTTSSLPPSSDLIKRSEKAPSLPPSDTPKRQPGGQLGHKGRSSKGFGRVDRYERLEPELCPECGGNHFEKSALCKRKQAVARLLERPSEIVEYQQITRACTQCGTRVSGELPIGVIAGQKLDAKLQGMLVWLGHYGHLSVAKQQEWLRELGVEISPGTIDATTGRVARAVEAPVSELKQALVREPSSHSDETPWLVKGVKEWLWVFAPEKYTLFHAGEDRSRAQLEKILGKSFQGVLISDDFSVYNGYKVASQQKCLAHLRRHFRQVSYLKASHQKQLAEAFLALIDEAFREHRQWRETKDATAYATWACSFKGRVQSSIASWQSKAGHAAGLLLKSLTDKAHQWWYFLEHPEIPPDNNRAERSLRLAVTKRKVAGGSRSWEGFRRSANLLSVIETCRQQRRSVVQFFEQAISYAATGRSRELSLIVP